MYCCHCTTRSFVPPGTLLTAGSTFAPSSPQLGRERSRDDLLLCQRASGGVPCTSGKGLVGFGTVSADENTTPLPLCSPLRPGAVPIGRTHQGSSACWGSPGAVGRCWCGVTSPTWDRGTRLEPHGARAARQHGAAHPLGARSVYLHRTGKINTDGSGALLKREAARLQHSVACLSRNCRALVHARGPDLQGQSVGSLRTGSVLAHCMVDSAARVLPGDRRVWLFISHSERARRSEGCNLKPPQAAGDGWVQPGAESLARKPGRSMSGMVRRDGRSWWQQGCVLVCGRAGVLPWPQRSCSCCSMRIHVYFCIVLCVGFIHLSHIFPCISHSRWRRVSSAPTGTRAQPTEQLVAPLLGKCLATRRIAPQPASSRVTVMQNKTGRCALAPRMTAT